MKKKLTLQEHALRQLISRQVLKKIVFESIKRNIVETVDFGALKNDLESAYQHFKVANQDIKMQPFNWDTIIRSFLQDPEAKQMIKIGDADGLANKMLELLVAEKPSFGDVDVNKHVEQQFAKSTQDDVDDAFARIQKKAS